MTNLVIDNTHKHKKRICRMVDFAVPADDRLKLKESEKRDKYLDLARELKKLWNMKSDCDTNCNLCARHSQQRIGTGTGGLGNKRTSWNHPNYNIVEICQNTKKSPGDFQIQPILGEWRQASRKSRREPSCYILIANWSYKAYPLILKQEPQLHCLTCQTTCTVKHILIECRTFAVIRRRLFKVNYLTDLFENVKIDDILSFLRGTELYQKIWQLKTG